MAIETLCTPALLFLIYSFTQIVLDTIHGLFNTALIKFILSIFITITLNMLCLKRLKIISWIIVFIPFIFLTIITSIIVLGIGLNPYMGSITVDNIQHK